MSREELLLHFVSSAKRSGCDDAKILEIFSYEPKSEYLKLLQPTISKEELATAIKICDYKPLFDQLPEKWVDRFARVAADYHADPRPSLLFDPFCDLVLQFLDGADLSTMQIAFNGNHLFEHFAEQKVRSRRSCNKYGITFTCDDVMAFPIYRTCRSYKFLYHLLFAYPNLAVIGGPYANKKNPGIASRTSLALCGHRKYVAEKALKEGGLAFCLNVLERVSFNKKVPPASDSFLSCSNDRDIRRSLQMLHTPPRVTDHFRYMFIRFDPEYGCAGAWAPPDADVNKHDYIRMKRTKTFGATYRLIKAIKPFFPNYAWTQFLTKNLCSIAYNGCFEMAAKFVELGARLLLDQECLDVIDECARCGGENGIKVLIEIFNAGSEQYFEDNKLTERQLRRIISIWERAYYTDFKKCMSLLKKKPFILSPDSVELLYHYI